MKAVLLALALGVFCCAQAAQAEDFSVGGFNLSSVIKETLPSGGEAWDDEANYRKWIVTKVAEEPVLRFSISVSTGKVGEPHAEHDVTVFATDQDRAFLMDFGNALDSADDSATRGFDRICARDVATLGGATRSLKTVGTSANLPYSLSVIVDRDMEPAARKRTLDAIDLWISRGQKGSASPLDLTRTLKFKKLAAMLGPDFRGAIVSCGLTGFMEPTAIWETRFLDLPLAATVFNLNPE